MSGLRHPLHTYPLPSPGCQGCFDETFDKWPLADHTCDAAEQAARQRWMCQWCSKRFAPRRRSIGHNTWAVEILCPECREVNASAKSGTRSLPVATAQPRSTVARWYRRIGRPIEDRRWVDRHLGAAIALLLVLCVLLPFAWLHERWKS